MHSQNVRKIRLAEARESSFNPGSHGLFDIIIQANGLIVTEKLRAAVSRKIGRVRQYAPHALRARVQFAHELTKAPKDQFLVLVRYEIPGNDILAQHRASEPMTALDLVSEKIERRLRKRKTAFLAKRSRQKGNACRMARILTNE